MTERVRRATAQFPLQVKTLLQQALLLDDRFERQEVSPHGLSVATGLLEAAMDRLLDKDYRSASAGETSAPAARIPVHVSALSGFGRNQQSGRTGHPSGSDRPQGVGWQPHPEGGRRTANLDERVAHLPAAGQRRLHLSGGVAAFTRTE